MNTPTTRSTDIQYSYQLSQTHSLVQAYSCRSFASIVGTTDFRNKREGGVNVRMAVGGSVCARQTGYETPMAVRHCSDRGQHTRLCGRRGVNIFAFGLLCNNEVF